MCFLDVLSLHLRSGSPVYIKVKDRVGARISKETYPFVYAYAIKNELYIEEAVDEIMRIDIRNFDNPKHLLHNKSMETQVLDILERRNRSSIPAHRTRRVNQAALLPNLILSAA